jgi:two-component system, LuxR family, sensor kinase FixL
MHETLQRTTDDPPLHHGGGMGVVDRDAADANHARHHRSMCPVSDPALFESLVDHPGMLVMGVDTAGCVMWVSRGFEELTGYAFEEIKGRDWITTFIPPEHQEDAAKQCRGRIGQNRAQTHLKPILCKGGSIRHVEWVHSDIKDDQGSITGILCVGRDVTELLAAREALLTSEKQSRAIVETAVNAIITMSETCIIETANSATERIFGYKREEIIGKNVQVLMPQPYRAKHDSYVKNYISSGVKKIIGIGREAVAQRKDGSIFPIDLSVGEVILSDGRRVFTGIIRDLSDRKMLEEKILHISEEEQHRIGQDIHDDLCQQLAAIGCLAKVAHQQLSKTGSAQAENLDEIVRLVTQANTRAREMSRGLMPVVLDSAGLMAALADLAQSTERVFRVSCPFRCDRPVQVPDNKMATQLYRIAQEAVANAIKHSRADRIEIGLSEGDGEIALSIRDNGIGIPDNISGRSTGMGLLTMSHRARMMGGELAVEHDDFGGTIVRCQIPVPTSQPSLRRQPSK